MIRRTWFAALAASVLAACGSGVGSGGTGGPVGTLSVSLTDNPCDFRNVFVTIDRLRVHPSDSAADDDAGWRDVPLSLSAAQRRVDLLQLQNGVFLKLGDLQLPAGRYTQLRLVLAENSGAGTPANAVVLSDGTSVPLTTPSAQRSGLKLVRPFDVAANQTVELLLDFDACRSVVRNGGSGRYTLKPTIAVIPLADVGRIRGSTTALPGTRVSAQTIGADGSPVVVKSTAVAPDGTFVLSPLPAPGTGARYTVVVAAPNVATSVIRDVPVARQVDTVLSATPIPGVSSGSSTLSGTVVQTDLDGVLVRALQSVNGTKLEIASAPPDATLGTYALQVSRAPVRLAAYPASTPIPPVQALNFSEVVGLAGQYSVQAVGQRIADGRTAVVESAVLNAAGANVVVPELRPVVP